MNMGLTGGIATGKSTVSSMLSQRGANIIDADQIAREVVLPGSPVLSEVAYRFGQAILLDDGTLDRKRLGQIVFTDVQARKDLEAILHPPIRSIMKQRMIRFEQENPHQLVVVDVPLLYESNLEGMFSEVMLVYVPRGLQIRRLMDRDRLSMEEAEQRLSAQMPIEEKLKKADYVIDNSGTTRQTEQQIEQFWHRKGLG